MTGTNTDENNFPEITATIQVKDASITAVNGSHASNVAIVIITKSGKKGGAMKTKYRFGFRVSSPFGLPNSLSCSQNPSNLLSFW